jgi:hypothetical protein
VHNPRLRLWTDASLLVLAVLLAVAIALPVLAPARPWLALAACALLPGAAVLTLIPVEDFFTWCLVSILVSLAAGTITSLAILWLGVWHPLTLAGVLGAASILLLTKDLYSAIRSPAPATA